MTILSLPLVLAGLALLAMAMHRHAAQVGLGGWPIRRRTALRGAGWATLSLSLLPHLIGARWRIGLVEWIGQLTLAAAIVALLLTYRPRALPPAVGVSFAVAAISVAYHSA